MNGGISCVDWRGPFFLRLDWANRKKDKTRTVYRVDHNGAVVYIGSTTLSWPCRLYHHSRCDYPFAEFLRATPAREISVSLIEAAHRDLESFLISALQPRFNSHYARWMEVAALRAQGLSLREIAERYGVTPVSVCQMLRRIDPAAATAGGRKIAEEQHEEIIRLRAAGLTMRAIADMYGVTPGAIHFIIHPGAREKNRLRSAARRAA